MKAPWSGLSSIVSTGTGFRLDTGLLRRAAVALLLVVLVPSVAFPEWRRLDSENFTIIGDAGERQLRGIAQRLEQFRDALTRVLSRARVTSTVPTVVFVFSSRRAHEPFMPVYNGKRVDVAGAFGGGPDVNYVTMNLEYEEAAYRIIFHEYAHHIVDNTLRWVPQWFNEGIAEYYSSFLLTDDGRKAYVGGAIAEHVLLLRGQSMLPLTELFGVTHDSPLYNEGARRSVFYAQSWALVHYLLHGEAARRAQLFRFLDRVAVGQPAEPAFRETFGIEPPVLQKELAGYVQRWTFMATQVTFTERIATARPMATLPVANADAEAELVNLLARLTRVTEAQQRLDRLLGVPTPGGRAFLAQGRLHLQEGRFEQAVPSLERAVSLLPDEFLAHYALGMARLRALTASGRGFSPNDGALVAARAALTRALELQPDSPEVLAQLGRVEVMDRKTLATARTRLQRAVELAPTRPHYKLMLAEALIDLAEYQGARDILGPLVAADRDQGIREHARLLMSSLATAENRTRSLAGLPSGAPAAEESSTSSTRETGRYIPILRDLNAGEQRVEARFLAIDCGAATDARAKFVRTSDGGALTLAVADLATVEFIAYRDDLTGSITCGTRPKQDRVLVTWVAQAPAVAGLDGRLVAVEFVRDDYVHR